MVDYEFGYWLLVWLFLSGASGQVMIIMPQSLVCSAAWNNNERNNNNDDDNNAQVSKWLLRASRDDDEKRESDRI